MLWIQAVAKAFSLPSGWPTPYPAYGTGGPGNAYGVAYPGETVTAYASVYNTFDDCVLVGTQYQCDNATYPVYVSWEVTCNVPGGTFPGAQGTGAWFYNTEYLPSTNSYNVLPPQPGTLASFQFKIDPAVCGLGYFTVAAMPTLSPFSGTSTNDV